MISYEEGQRLFLPLPTRYVFIFVNPRSGPQQGRTLLSNVEVQHYRMKSYPQVQVQLYDITNDADRKAGEAYLQWIWNESPVFKEQHQELHIWSAGGDGTFKGVLDICLSLGIDLTSPLLYFSVIPCEFYSPIARCQTRLIPHPAFPFQSELETISRKSSAGAAQYLITTLPASVSRN